MKYFAHLNNTNVIFLVFYLTLFSFFTLIFRDFWGTLKVKVCVWHDRLHAAVGVTLHSLFSFSFFLFVKINQHHENVPHFLSPPCVFFYCILCFLFYFFIWCRWVSECWSTLQPRLPFVELLWCQSRDHHQVVFKVQKQRWCYVKKKKNPFLSVWRFCSKTASTMKREGKSKHFLIILKRRQTHTSSLITELQWTERWHLGWSCDQSVVSPLNSVIEFIWGAGVLVTGSSPGLGGVWSELRASL